LKVFACDIGFGHTKYIEANVQDHRADVTLKGTFPSVTRRLVSSDFYRIDEHPDFVQLDGKNYLVGSSAALGDRGFRVRSSDFLLEIFPCLLSRALKERKTNGKLDLLVLGTPLQEWNRLKKELVQAASPFADRVECFPQAASAAMVLKSSSSFLVVDIGYNTCDAVPVDENGLVLSDRGVSWERLGISAIVEEIQDALKNSLGLSLGSVEAEEIVRMPKKIKKIAPEAQDMAGFVRNMIEEHAIIINARIIDRFGPSAERVVLGGGGARILGKPLRALRRSVTALREPEFANAKGFLMLGLAVMGYYGKVCWAPEQQQHADAGETGGEAAVPVISDGNEKKAVGASHVD